MRGVVAGLGFVAIGLIAFKLGAVGAQEDASRPEYYTSKVLPIFKTNCGSCHLGTNRRGGFNMETREGLLKGGHDGAVIVPGDPSKSLLVKLIRHEGPADDPMPMPPRKPKISDEDIATVTAWVKAGAVMPVTQ
jgi:mono/diheme cytochrome c family protein